MSFGVTTPLIFLKIKFPLQNVGVVTIGLTQPSNPKKITSFSEIKGNSYLAPLSDLRDVWASNFVWAMWANFSLPSFHSNFESIRREHYSFSLPSFHYNFESIRREHYSEAATRCVLWKKMFLEISQNSYENTSGDSFWLFYFLRWWVC